MDDTLTGEHEEIDDGAEELLALIASGGVEDPGAPPKIDSPIGGTVDLHYGVEIDGTRYRRCTVRELNGTDQEKMDRISLDEEGWAIRLLDLVINRAVLQIGPHNVADHPGILGKMLTGDRDLLWAEVLFATFGEVQEFDEIECPHCKAKNFFEVNVRDMLKISGLIREDATFEVTTRKGDVLTGRYPVGDDYLAALAVKEINNIAVLDTFIMAKVLRTVNGAPIADPDRFARELGIVDRRTVVTALRDAPAVTFEEVKVSCSGCAEIIPFIIGWADLLRL
jgi:hypothetical protein